MKKVALVLLSIMLFSILVTAKSETTVNSGYGTVFYIDGVGEHCYIENEYYSIYADEYFEMQYAEYVDNYDDWLKYADFDDYFSKMYMSLDSVYKSRYSYVEDIINGNGIWYCTVIFDYDSDFSKSKNEALANVLFNDVDVLYVGNTTPCAVVKINGGTDEIVNIIENNNVAFVYTAFEQYSPFSTSTAMFEYTYNPTAADARKILRYSAGLDSAPEDRLKAKKFLFTSDTDFDGVITASDARTSLRISAGLEKGYTFYDTTVSASEHWC